MRKGEFKTFYKAFNPYVTHFEQKKKRKIELNSVKRIC